MALGDRVGGAGPDRVVQADETEVLEVEVVLFGGEAISAAEPGAGDGEHPQPSRAGCFDLRVECGACLVIEVAEVGDRFGGALGGDDVVGPVR